MFYINTKQAERSAEDIRRVSSALGNIGSEIESAANSGLVIGDPASSGAIKRALRRSAQNVGELSRTSDRCSSTLSSIVLQYKDADAKAANAKTTGSSTPKAPSGGKKDKPGDVKPNTKSLRDMLKDGDLKGSVVNGKAEVGNGIVGASAAGELLTGSIKYSESAEWNAKEGSIGAGVGIKAEGSLAKGTLEGHAGPLSGEITGSVGNAEAKGEVGITLFNQGRFEPGAKAEASAKVSAAHGKIEGKLGNDEYNVNVGADGDVLVAKAEAEAHAGYYTYKDSATGEVKKGFGVGASAGAEAYVAEGKVSGGITIFGIKIDGSVSGKAGGAGAKAGGKVGTDSVEGEVGLGLGLGIGLKVKVDWTGFKLPWQK